jgi:hypothetical protein
VLGVRVLGALLGAIIAGLAVATIATGTGGSSATPGHDNAFGAGTFGPACWQTHAGPFCTPFNYTFRLLGVSQGESGRAGGVLERRNNVTGGVLRGDVTCMEVEGNRASIGGYLTPTSDAFQGDPFVVYVEDSGTLAADDGSTPDQISALGAFPPGDPDLPLMPEGFPAVCPEPPLDGYAPLTAGEITVSED